MADVDGAVSRVTSAMMDECEPRRMSKAEAVSFYEQLKSECEQWIETLNHEIQGDLRHG